MLRLRLTSKCFLMTNKWAQIKCKLKMASKRSNTEETSHDHKIRREGKTQRKSSSRGQKEDWKEEEEESNVQGGTVSRVQRRVSF